jgi:hypothetical protein
MGAKYIPSIKDLKANLRFHKKQLAAHRATIGPGAQAKGKPKRK